MQSLPDTETGLTYALEILKLGGVVAHATETCYGLACDMTNPEAVEKLFQIKNRAADQPVSALFPSIEATEEWVEWNEEALKLAKKELPGPLTIILPLKKENIYPTSPLHYSTTLGIRVSPHPVAQELSKQFGKPISTTSANISGKPNLYSTEEIQKQFEGREHQPELILDSGELERRATSKVVSFVDGEIKVIRK